MNSSLRQQIQAACDALYGNPDDEDALLRLRQLLGADPEVLRATWHRMVKAACDELYDNPDDHDTRDRLFMLLAARDTATG